MKLHQAIEFLINQNNSLMTIEEISKKINTSNFYKRPDKNPVPETQIKKCINEYSSLFFESDNKIGLLENIKKYNDLFDSKLLEKLLDILTRKISEYQSYEDSILIVCSFYLISFEINKEDNSISFNYNLILEKANYLISNHHQLSDIFEIIIKFRAVLSTRLFNEFEQLFYEIKNLNDDQWSNILEKYINKIYLSVKEKERRFLKTPTFFNNLFVELANLKKNEIVFDPASGVGYSLLNCYKKNHDIFLIGQEIYYYPFLLSKLIFYVNNVNNFQLFLGDSIKNPNVDRSSVDVIISQFPFGSKSQIDFTNLDFPISSNKNKYQTEELFIDFMLSRLNVKGRILTLLPESFLFGNSSFQLRKRLIDENLVEAVFSFNSMLEYNEFKINIVFVILNKSKDEIRKETVLFLNGELLNSSYNNQDEVIKYISDIYFSKEDDKPKFDYIEAKIDYIKNQNYDLIPENYTDEFYIKVQEEVGWDNILKLKDILFNVSSEKGNLDYSNTKIVQIKDLSDNPICFYLDTTKLDKIKKIQSNYKLISTSCLLVARIGSKLKPTYFKYKGESVLINNNIIAFGVGENIIDVEYLISQLKSEFFNHNLSRIRSKLAIPSFNLNNFLNLEISVPNSFIEQYNRLAFYKKNYSENLTITKFIKDIKLANTPEEIKTEIERFAAKSLNVKNSIVYKRKFEFEKFPYSENDILKTNFIKRSNDGLYIYLLLIDEESYHINGVLTIQMEGEISYEKYSEINTYSNFIIQASSKFIKENTSKLLKDFCHTTKNIIGDINKILNDFINSSNIDLINALKENYLKDDELINHFVQNDGREKEDYIAYNKLKEASNIITKHLDFFKRQHEYYTSSVKSKKEEIKLKDFIDKLINNKVKIINKANTDDILFIKVSPVERAFIDLINNAINYSLNENVNLSILSRDNHVQFTIDNSVKTVISEDNYKRFGKEEIKKPDGTYSTGLFEAFKCLNEENEIILAPYNFYKKNKVFRLTIKLLKK